MSLVLKDRVRETTTVLGTSDATLLGAVTGFQAFSVVGNGNTCYYTISDQSGGNWEVGIGTYSTVGPTLARTTILASSNSGSIVSFPAGTKDVFLTLPAEVAVVSSNNPSTAGYVLSSNGTGVAPSWVAGTSITVGAAGSNTQVQYNNSGVLGASSNFTFDGTNIGLAGGTANGVAYLNGSNVLTTGTALSFDGTKLSLVGGSNRFTATMTGGTIASRFFFQNAVANSNSIVRVMPSGTGIAARFEGYLSSDPDNASYFAIQGSANGTVDIASGLTGTGSYLPITFSTNGAEQMRLNSTGLGIGTSSPGYKLDVVGSSPRIKVSDASTGYAISQYSNTSGSLFIGIDDSTGGGFSQGGYARNIYSTGAYPLVFSTNSLGRMTLDSSGNLGLGVTPSAWSGFNAFQLGAGGALASTTGSQYGTYLSANAYNNGSWRYISSNPAVLYQQYAQTGFHAWYTAPSGTAGNAITFTQAMTLDASGNLGVGITAPTGRVHIKGPVSATAAQQLVFQYHSTSSNFLALGLQNGTGSAQIMAGSGADLIFYSNSDLSSTGEAMRINTAGNVGIGTSSPAQRLSITAANNSRIENYADSNHRQYVYSNAVTGAQASGIGQGGYVSLTSGGVWSGTKSYAGFPSYNVYFSNESNKGFHFVQQGAGSTTTDGGITDLMYLNDSGNLGLGVTPSAWNAGNAALETPYGWITGRDQLNIGCNLYYNYGTKYIQNGYATLIQSSKGSGGLSFQLAPSGTAGSAAAFTTAMTLDASGNLGIGTTAPAVKLDASGYAQDPSLTSNTGILRVQTATSNELQIGGYSTSPYSMWIQTKQSNNSGAVFPLILNPLGGNVAIGTSSPVSWGTPTLQMGVAGGLQYQATTQLALRGNHYYNGGDLFINATGYAQAIALDATAGVLFYSSTAASTGAGSAATMYERMRIDTSGNLLVGTTAAGNSEKLAVIGGNGIRCKSEFTLSGTTVVGIYSGVGGMIVIRDQTNGGTCIVLYENGVTPIIVSQSGSNFTTGTPSGTQIKLSSGNAGAPSGYGMSASTVAGKTAIIGVGIFSVDEA